MLHHHKKSGQSIIIIITWLQICNANTVTRAVTEAKEQRHVPDFPLTIRDVQNALAANEEC